MYLIGGVFFEECLSRAAGKALSEVKVFDPFNRKWVNRASLTVPRCAHAAVVVGEEIYVIGVLKSIQFKLKTSSVFLLEF